ncbi:Uu.00g069630.m01.CDS01 [Anthostomella pinea]|uniref:Uu.00g069630.m01.CDS01 n=1 Tax=Anthostomella pinea TaxID=933095 RepID=A0AAI8VVR8_9PEZI|nr:Uu.00g069630.m01.CDS01 [Anthostomella pinea]
MDVANATTTKNSPDSAVIGGKKAATMPNCTLRPQANEFFPMSSAGDYAGNYNSKSYTSTGDTRETFTPGPARPHVSKPQIVERFEGPHLIVDREEFARDMERFGMKGLSASRWA